MAKSDMMPYRPDASLQELMVDVVDRNADALWDAVTVVNSEKGIEEKQPRTDSEWAAVRVAAITLGEGANLLMIPGRKVVHQGKTLQDAGVEGILQADQIEALIHKDFTAFAMRALVLHQAALAALSAIDAKDADKLSETGGAIDEACEQCHTTYWYPNQRLPKAADALVSPAKTD